MSVRASAIVWEESQQKGSALLLLLALADYAHDDGTNAFPSVPTLAKKTRLGRRNIQLLLRKLEEAGEVAPMGLVASGTVVYRLILPGFSTGGVKFTSPKQPGGAKITRGGETPIAGGAITPSPDPLPNHQITEDRDDQFILRTCRRLHLSATEGMAVAKRHTERGRLNRAAFLAALKRR